MADAVEDDDDVIERIKAEAAAELASSQTDPDGPRSPDMSDDSSSEEELRWSLGPRKASTCVHFFFVAFRKLTASSALLLGQP